MERSEGSTMAIKKSKKRENGGLFDHSEGLTYQISWSYIYKAQEKILTPDSALWSHFSWSIVYFEKISGAIFDISIGLFILLAHTFL